MTDFVSMTREGYNRMKAEIERLEMVEMPLISEKIAEARAEGDLKENAEYHAQRENQGMMQAKINSLKSKLSKAHIVDTSTTHHRRHSHTTLSKKTATHSVPSPLTVLKLTISLCHIQVIIITIIININTIIHRKYLNG